MKNLQTRSQRKKMRSNRSITAVSCSTSPQITQQYFNHLYTTRNQQLMGIFMLALIIGQASSFHLQVDTTKKALLAHQLGIDPHNSQRVEALLREGSDPNYIPGHGEPPLNVALRKQAFKTAQLLLDHQADPNLKDKEGVTALHVAAAHDTYAGMLHALIQHRAKLDVQADKGETPLHVAAYKGAALIASTLLIHHANPNIRDNDSATALHWAVTGGFRHIVTQLLNHKANPNIQNRRGEAPLHLAGIFNSPAAIVQALLDAKADIELKTDRNETPLAIAAYHNSYDAVHVLLANGANMYAWGQDGIPFYAAVNHGDEKILRLFLKQAKGDNLSAKAPLLLHLAAQQFADGAQKAQLLIAQGFDINWMQYFQGQMKTPLEWAVTLHNLSVVKLLLEKGARIRANPDKPLSVKASEQGYTEMGRVLRRYEIEQEKREEKEKQQKATQAKVQQATPVKQDGWIYPLTLYALIITAAMAVIAGMYDTLLQKRAKSKENHPLPIAPPIPEHHPFHIESSLLEPTPKSKTYPRKKAAKKALEKSSESTLTKNATQGIQIDSTVQVSIHKTDITSLKDKITWDLQKAHWIQGYMGEIAETLRKTQYYKANATVKQETYKHAQGLETYLETKKQSITAESNCYHQKGNECLQKLSLLEEALESLAQPMAALVKTFSEVKQTWSKEALDASKVEQSVEMALKETASRFRRLEAASKKESVLPLPPTIASVPTSEQMATPSTATSLAHLDSIIAKLEAAEKKKPRPVQQERGNDNSNVNPAPLMFSKKEGASIQHYGNVNNPPISHKDVLFRVYPTGEVMKALQTHISAIKKINTFIQDTPSVMREALSFSLLYLTDKILMGLWELERSVHNETKPGWDPSQSDFYDWRNMVAHFPASLHDQDFTPFLEVLGYITPTSSATGILSQFPKDTFKKTQIYQALADQFKPTETLKEAKQRFERVFAKFLELSSHSNHNMIYRQALMLLVAVMGECINDFADPNRGEEWHEVRDALTKQLGNRLVKKLIDTRNRIFHDPRVDSLLERGELIAIQKELQSVHSESLFPPKTVMHLRPR